MKDIPAAVLTAMEAGEGRPINLGTIMTATPLRFATSSVNVSFGGNTYTAWEVKVGTLTQKADQYIDSLTVKLDNADGTMEGYHLAESFFNKALIVRRIFRGTTSSSTYYDEVFYGVIEEITSDDTWLTVKATQGERTEKKGLISEFTASCRHLFGDTQCNQDGYASLASLTASGTADSGSTTTLVHSSRTEADDFWKYGLIAVTKGAVTETREIDTSDHSTTTLSWLIPLSFAVDATTTYVVYKGCDKILTTCQGNNAWGPSADNFANFGGWLHMTRKETDA